MQLNLGIVSALDDQIAALQKQKAAAVAEFKGAAIEKMKADIAVLGITAADLCFVGEFSNNGSSAAYHAATGKVVAVKSKDGKVEPKYIDPVSGKTWTGRGKAPKWIDGQDRVPFLIASPAVTATPEPQPQDLVQELADTTGKFTEAETEVTREPAVEAA